EHEEATQRLGIAKLRPEELHAEATPLRVAELLLDGHATVIELEHTARVACFTGGEPPRLVGAGSPIADDADGHLPVGAERDDAQVEHLSLSQENIGQRDLEAGPDLRENIALQPHHEAEPEILKQSDPRHAT